MYSSYDDIVSRIPEAPTWWMDGFPRYREFSPDLVADFQATEALLVHIRCQACKRDFHVGLGDRRPYGQPSYMGLLNTQSQLGVIGDPPSHNCDGAGSSMTAEEVAVLEFWHRFTTPNKGFREWVRHPELQRSLEEPDSALEERHLAAWSRIRRFRRRSEGLMGKWTPTRKARFTEADIVRAIKGFQSAGLEVGAVQIWADGTIGIVRKGYEEACDDWRKGSPLYADRE